MSAPTAFNPMVCDTSADTIFLASCAIKFLARSAEDRTHEGTAALTSSESAGEHILLTCIAAALDYAQAQQEGGEA